MRSVLTLSKLAVSRVTVWTLRYTSRHQLSTNRKRLLRRDRRMSAGTDRRVMVYVKQDDTEPQPVHFSQCLVELLEPGCQGNSCEIYIELVDGKLCLSRGGITNTSSHTMMHPSFCPVHELSKEEKLALPDDIQKKGVHSAVSILLESGDGKILLSKRADHLRTFPGIWVPPGGHIEEEKKLDAAGLRELEEETGLMVTKEMYHCPPNVIAVWESVYPPKLSLGTPKRHHAVVYIHVKLNPHITAGSLRSKFKIDAGEVGAVAWFERSKVEAITAAREDGGQSGGQTTQTFSAVVVDSAGKESEEKLPFLPLLQTAADDKDTRGRVSTGTKFALEQWLKLT